MPAITNDWAEYLRPEYKKDYYRKLFDFVGNAYETQTVYPPADDIFNAFHNTLNGEMCYHRPGSIS